jgi:hypothetical protein
MPGLSREASKRRGKSLRRPKARPRRTHERLLLLVATRKGGFIFHGDPVRKDWVIDGPHFLGHIINHIVLDPRDGRTMLMAAKTGHLGPTIFRSVDLGRTWQEATHPPAFAKAREGEPQRAVDYTFWLAPGHSNEPSAWYAGTSPRALFRSDDGGVSWYGIDGFNNHPMLPKWAPPEDQTPDGATLHSIVVDPRDPAHLYIGMSGGGVFESLDKGASWHPLNKGVEANFMPDPYPEYGQDPHCVRMHPMMPDRLYQQNHCGIYKLDRPSDKWDRIGRQMPKEIGDIGFPIVLHPRDPDTLWVIPMDGTTVWPRTSPDGKPAAYRTRDAGITWERQDRGLPKEQAWFTVKRQAFACDQYDPVGLYFGTTGGELWMSPNEGASWRHLAAHLPEILAVETATVIA